MVNSGETLTNTTLNGEIAIQTCVRNPRRNSDTVNKSILLTPFKSDRQEISTIEGQVLKNRFLSFFVRK